MLSDWDDIWERFCIMTVEGMQDEECLAYLRDITDPEMYKKLVNKVIFGF